MDERRQKLRTAITENLRVQRGGATPVPYIDTTHALTDISARQNHAVFARRGCGKTLLLHQSADHLPSTIRAVYLNCEDFKTHSFPNVLIEILDSLFGEMEKNLTGWFGKQRKLRDVIATIRKELSSIKEREDEREQSVTESRATERKVGGKLGGSASGLSAEATASNESKVAIELEYVNHDNKLRALNLWLPKLKGHIRDFFPATDNIAAVFVQVDDFYHLRRADQPHVMDYLHRLCKDVPLYFKVATLRHASTLYADRDGQPTGAQERHDYQPINIDFTFHDFKRTASQVRRIFDQFGQLAGYAAGELDDLFMGEGFNRLVLVGGGVPRDCLSLFLEVLGELESPSARIGKDQVRVLSSSNFERRISELKKDSESGEQDVLLRGIYMIRTFCLDKKINVFSIEDKLMQQSEFLRDLVYRLLDYRIIHSVANSFTHKSQPGVFQAFAIDAGCYGSMRKLQDKFTEIDLGASDAHERIRSTPVLLEDFVARIVRTAPANVEAAIKEQGAMEDSGTIVHAATASTGEE